MIIFFWLSVTLITSGIVGSILSKDNIGVIVIILLDSVRLLILVESLGVFYLKTI